MLQSGFSLSDVKELHRTYSDGEGEDHADHGQYPGQGPPNQTSWQKRKSMMMVKTKSFENELKVPTVQEAQAMMSITAPKTRSTSVEALNKAGKPGDPEVDHKIRSKSPFKFFMGKLVFGGKSFICTNRNFLQVKKQI